MTRLDVYRSALLAACPDVADAELARALDAGGPCFVSFVVDHGLGPVWHERTGRDGFHASRLSAEALYLAQENALSEIDTRLNNAGIEYAVIKGAATRLLLHENPAIRSCHDLDLLVGPQDRVRAASALVESGFTAMPKADNIGHELVLSSGAVDIDLHWGLLREGRLRSDCAAAMLGRRRRLHDVWMLDEEDAFFLLLVHPAFVKHLGGWEMGLHRVADIMDWLRTQSFDWPTVHATLEANGVRTAAWATLRWVELLTRPHTVVGLEKMVADLSPGRLRRTWLDFWLRNDLSARTSAAHWVRLLCFSLFLHDTLRDSARALVGWHRAQRRSSADIDAFRQLPG